MCGGYPHDINVLSKIVEANNKCFMLDVRLNQWSQLPSLISGVSYAAATFVERLGLLFIIGGKDQKAKI